MEIWGDFEVYRDQLIGKGGWGEVYKGRQISLNRSVAIKILKEELTRDRDFVRRFHREAECLAKLADEHIIQVYGAGEYQNSYYFAMEYIPGVTLDKFIERGYKFTPAEVVHLGLAVTKALKSAWESTEQIIHRDIKPSNILLAFPKHLLDKMTGSDRTKQPAGKQLDIRQAKIKVMDFGLARVIKESSLIEGETPIPLSGNREPSDVNLTMAGMILGTPKYIPPEQGLGKSVDIRSDIYSLGIVLYEMATGRTPFKSDDIITMIRQHIYEIPPSPHRFNPHLPLLLETVIMKCIQKRPEDRYNNPSELFEDLEALRQHQPPRHTLIKTMTQKPAKTAGAKLSKIFFKILALLILLAVIIATGAIVTFLLSSENPSIDSFFKPEVIPAQIGEPSAENILGNDQTVKVISHHTESIDNIFDYGIRVKCFIQNYTAEIQNRRLKMELNWSGKTYFKEQTVFLEPKGSNTFFMNFYEPTGEGGIYYNYKVLLTELPPVSPK